MKKFTLLLSFLFLTCSLLQAQRYLEEVFTDDDILLVEDVVYGNNITVLAIGTAGLIPEDLKMDIYHPSEPAGTQRPVAIVVHTGNFLPPTFNGGCGGTKKDADVVELSRRLARMGYVACAIDYRLGWDPTNTDQTVRTFTIINASYRGMQDLNTAIKFLKKTVAEDNNPYGVSDNQIMALGFGTGGYITYGAATLGSTQETWIPKFVTPAGPMVHPDINGDIDANNDGFMPVDFPPFSAGDQLCKANHTGYDADYQLSVQFGGANGDTSWVTPGDVPMISTHVTTDPFAPYNIGIVNVPPPINLPVVEVMGAGTIIPLANAEGVNAILDQAWIDPISTQVASVNGGANGLYPLFSTDPTESAPWNFTYVAEPYGVPGSDCPTDQAGAMVFMDSIVGYIAPRACLALGLGCDLTNYIEDFTSTEQLEDSQVGLEVAPNPASDYVYFSTETAPIQKMVVFDMTGKQVRNLDNINSNTFKLNRGNLPQGMYVAYLGFEEGYISKKIVFEK